MTDERPRPQYGEYATPEEQAKAAGQKYDPWVATPAASRPSALSGLPRVPGQVPGALPPTPVPEDRYTAAPPPGPATAGSRVPTRHPIDRFVTFLLLGVGVFYLGTSVPGYVHFATWLDRSYEPLGLSAYPNPNLADQVGIWMLVAHVILFAATMVIAVRRVRAHRISSWVPVVGFVLFVVVFALAFTVLFQDSPTYFQHLSDLMLGAK